MICLLILLFIIFNNGKDKLEAYLQAAVGWTLILLGLVYGGSLVRGLAFLPLAGSYFIIDIALAAFIIRKRKSCLRFPGKEFFSGAAIKSRLFSAQALLAAGILILFGAVFYYALRSAPYNWDSMTYHLPRIASWDQNGSVFPFASHIERQVASPVLGAYVNLFVYILGGRHDRMLNFLQCASYGTNALLVYGIARKLGVETKTSFLAPVIYMGTPIALAEATTTQVDNFAAMWLLAFVYFMLDLTEGELKWEKDTKRRVACGALCIALGYLAKPSVCFANLLFLIWLLIVCIRRKTDIKVMAKYLVLAALLIGVVLLPGFICSIAAFGSASHSAVGQRQLVGSFHPFYILVNFLKNFTFNLASYKVEATGVLIEKFLYGISGLLGVDLNSPAISEDGRMFEFPPLPAFNCDSALNMFLLVAAICFFIWFLVRGKRQSRIVRGFSIYAVGSFLVFCMFLRWEKFINRYMIAYFALLAVFITVQAYDMASRVKKPAFTLGVCGLLVLGSLVNYYGGIQYLRSIAPFSKPEGYFTYYGGNKENYLAVVNEIQASGSGKVGVVIGGDSFEYPLWAMLKNQGYEIRHIMVDNPLGKYEEEEFVPDYIFMERGSAEMLQYHQQDYYRKTGGAEETFCLYVKH